MIATALDAILALVVLEGAALCGLHRFTGRGIAPVRLLPNLAAGFALMLAARLALQPGIGAAPLAACLAAALAAHLADLAMRWRS